MRLSEIAVGCEGIIKHVAGTEKVCRFLYSIGCYPGERITLVSVLAGNYIVRIKGSRFAVDRKIAQIIELGEVTPGADEPDLGCRHRQASRV